MREQIDHGARAAREPHEVDFAVPRLQIRMADQLAADHDRAVVELLERQRPAGRAERRAAKRRDALRDHQHQSFRMQRHRFAGRAREFARPRTGRDQQFAGRERAARRLRDPARAAPLEMRDRRAFMKARAVSLRGDPERGGRAKRQRVAVALDPDAARHVRRERGLEFAHARAVDQRFVRVAVRFEQRDARAAFVELRLGFGDLQLAGRHEPARIADQIGQRVPQLARQQRKRNLLERPAERTHAAGVDARRMARDVVGLEHDHARAAPRELPRAARAVQAAADHDRIGFVAYRLVCAGHVTHRPARRA
ncbi:hypothetical protein FEP58_06020 [Burkholderia multivorans]|nr:hypothetical protein [Burkholderia multivorans]